MPTVTKNVTHDMLQLRVTHQKGTSLILTRSRNGSKITLKPSDLPVEAALSAIIAWEDREIRKENKPTRTYGQTFDTLEIAAKASTSYADFAKRAAEALDCTTEFPLSTKRTGPIPTTIVTQEKKRGEIVSIDFASGQQIQLTINGSSIGMLSNPEISVIDGRLSEFVFGAKMLKIESATIANAVAEQARQSPDPLTFVQGLTSDLLKSL